MKNLGHDVQYFCHCLGDAAKSHYLENKEHESLQCRSLLACFFISDAVLEDGTNCTELQRLQENSGWA